MALLVLCSIVAAVGVAADAGWLTAAAGLAAAFIFWFFRDPDRVPPAGMHDLVSPADGRVVEV